MATMVTNEEIQFQEKICLVSMCGLQRQIDLRGLTPVLEEHMKETPCEGTLVLSKECLGCIMHEAFHSKLMVKADTPLLAPGFLQRILAKKREEDAPCSMSHSVNS